MKRSVAVAVFVFACLHSLTYCVEKRERADARVSSDLVLLAFYRLWWSSLDPGIECLFCPNEGGHSSFSESWLSVLPNIPLA